MPFGDFRDLDVWQRAMEQQRVSFMLARRLPREAHYELASQIRRASNSVVSNIVEGHGQPTRRHFRKYVGSARASNRELLAHFLSAVCVEYVTESDVAGAIELNGRVGRMLTRLFDYLERPEADE